MDAEPGPTWRAASALGPQRVLPALIACACLMAPWIIGPAGGVHSEPAFETSGVRLKLATMDLGHAPAAAKPGAAEVPPPPTTSTTWRHTFGSERRTKEVVVRVPKAGFAADLIALQGVTGPAQARQAFPADQYQIVFSRQLLRAHHELPAAEEREPSVVTTTAVAVARRPDLRVIAQEHLLGLAHETGGTHLRLSAGTAVRVLAGNQALWVLSVDLAEGCIDARTSASAAACRAWEMQVAEIARWLAAKQAAGEAALVAGDFHRLLDLNKLPGPLAQVPRASGQPRAASCAKPGSNTTMVSLLLATPEENPAHGRWAFGDPATLATEGSCTTLVDLVGQ